MSLYTYITEGCREDLHNHDFTAVVEKYAETVEREQKLVGVSRYPQPFLKRNVGRQGRLLIEERQLDDDILVLCFLRVLIRGQNDYERFMRSAEAQKAFLDKHKPSDEEVRAEIERRESTDPVKPLPKITPVENHYLFGVSGLSKGSDEMIVESREWVDRIRSEKIQRELRLRYGELLADLVSSTDRDPEARIIESEDGGEYKILYRHLPSLNKWFIVAPVLNDVSEDEAKLRSKYNQILEAPEADCADLVLQKGLRSYPAFITVEEQLWLNTQQSEDANLALSPEETDVLNSVLQVGEDTESYPLFINGRPGSGKSTVLLYLFAEHLHFHLEQVYQKESKNGDALEYPPIYLTYSEDLLADAKRIVGDILRCDSEKSQSEYDLSSPTIQSEINRAFGSFRPFLLDLLPDDEKANFGKGKYIDYSAFKEQVLTRLSKHPNQDVRNISAEVSWHVIRTFIKGMRQDSDAYVDPDYYDLEIPRRQQSVSKANFEMVYEHIWEGFYREMCEDEGFWDDQDLARRLLDLENDQKVDTANYFGIFCDEAQDFTKIELELIFRISRFARRRVNHFNLGDIPFAFAGDPFQTLNPTGFDWDATKASFHDNIIRQLDPSGQASLEFNFRELAFNYRSARPIVQFCNLIQLIRGRAFGLTSLQPQKTWQLDAAPNPVYYTIDQPICKQSLRSESALVIIVPCQEGKEEEYVKNDTFLRSIAWDDDTQTMQRDVLSPMRAKGLQFDRVALYKFGDFAHTELSDQIPLLEETNTEPPEKEKTLGLEYFINQLYVAASRPRRQLVIVDTQDGIREFWKFATDSDQDALINGYEGGTKWTTDNLIVLRRGNEGNWTEIQDDPSRLGQDFFDRGRHQRDPYLLNSAFRNFMVSGKEAKAYKAKALRHEYKSEWVKAGMVYAGKLEDNVSAVRCFWKVGAYEKITELGGRREQVSNTLKFYAARYLDEPREERHPRQIFSQIYNRLEGDNGDLQDVLVDDRWKEVIATLIDDLSATVNDDDAPGEWSSIYAKVRDLKERGVPIESNMSLAKIAYAAGDYEYAAKLIHAEEGVEDPEDLEDWQVEVFANDVDFPDSVQYLYAVGDYREVLSQYRSSDIRAFTEEQRARILDACLKEGDVKQAIALVNENPTEEELTSLLATDDLDGEDEKWIYDTLVRIYIARKDWRDAVALAQKGHVASRGRSWSGEPINLSPEKKGERMRSFVTCIAESDAVALEDHSELRLVSGSIKEWISRDPGSKRDMVKHIGASFERIGKHIDAMEFYDSVKSGTWGSEKDLKRWARVRWLLCLNRKKRLNSNIDGSYHDDVLKHAKPWNITVEELSRAPRYPNTTPFPFSIQRALDTSERGTDNRKTKSRTNGSPPKKTTEEVVSTGTQNTSSVSPPRVEDSEEVAFSLSATFEIRDQEYKVSRKGQMRSLDIEQTSTQVRLVVTASKGTVNDLYDQLTITEMDEGDKKTFRIDEWALRVVMQESEDKTSIELKDDPTGVLILSVSV